LRWRTLTGALRQWYESEQALVWVGYWSNLTDEVRDWFASKKGLVWVEINTLPLRLAPGKLYVVGEEALLRTIAMQCPCGCGGNIHINLLPNARPSWQVTHHSDGTVSLHPTIQSQSGCGSRFFVRRSRVYWWNTETLGPGKVSADIATGVVQRSALQSRQLSLSSATSQSARILVQ
jgi:hypothetical protein